MKRKYKTSLNNNEVSISKCPRYYDLNIYIGSQSCQYCGWFKRMNVRKQFVICTLK